MNKIKEGKGKTVPTFRTNQTESIRYLIMNRETKKTNESEKIIT